jgi:hypothetical protein
MDKLERMLEKQKNNARNFDRQIKEIISGTRVSIDDELLESIDKQYLAIEHYREGMSRYGH